MKSVVVIGGGASGLMCAISIKRKINNADVPVLLIVSEGSITDYKTGETAIKQYLQSLKK